MELYKVVPGTPKPKPPAMMAPGTPIGPTSPNPVLFTTPDGPAMIAALSTAPDSPKPIPPADAQAKAPRRVIAD